MTRGFRRKRDGRIEIFLSADELALLRQVVAEMLDLLGENGGEKRDSEPDPLARMVGIGESTRAPDDPVLARLFPDAYSGDPEAAGEFRRYTQDGLNQQKRDVAERISSDLSDSRGHFVLSSEHAQAWMRALNDVRLALGTRLGVTEEAHEAFADMAPDDPRYPAYAAYDWLSFVLETLVRSLS